MLPRLALLLTLLPTGLFAQAPLEWDLRQAQWKGPSLPGAWEARAEAAPRFDGDDYQLDGNNYLTVPALRAAKLPKKAITAEAWVALDEGLQWGGIVMYSQDNGNYEKGWLLGYDHTRFAFGVSNGPKIEYLYAKTKFETGRWYHLAGTYDGNTIKLYLDGKLDAKTTLIGPIDYPPESVFTIGAYKDANECYAMKGKLRTVRISDRALDEQEIRARARKGGVEVHEPLAFTISPYLKFLSPDSAEVVWETADDTPAFVDFGREAARGNSVPATATGATRRAVLTGLKPNTRYQYRIRAGTRTSMHWPMDTGLNYSLFPTKAGTGSGSAHLARRILERTRADKGYCLLVGSGDGSLAAELVRNSELRVVGVDTDAARAEAARRALYRQQLYGTRVTIHTVASYDHIPMTSCFANLAVADQPLGKIAGKEMQRLLAPGRGVLCLYRDNTTQKWPVTTRAPLPGSGEWTHQYGSAGNTASTGDTLSGAASTSDLAVQWIGRPGGDFGIDRQPRMPAPLSVNGRLFHQGMNRLIALDSYNGTVLWGMEIPELRRLNMPRDASNWCADAERLYIAVRDRAWVMNAQSGRRERTLTLPAGKPGSEWGYIGSAGAFVYGSSVPGEAMFREFWGKGAWFDANKPNAGTAKVCSNDFFAYRKGSDEPAWSYKAGRIINSTIAMGDGKVVFIESRNPAVLDLQDGRIGSPELWKEQFLVCLDGSNGTTLWEQPIDTEDGSLVFYLQYSPHGIIVTASNTKYHLYNFDPKTGKQRWKTDSAWAANHHSGHIQHPVVVGDRVYLEPRGFDVHTGKLVADRIGRREGCTTYIGSTGALIYRGKSRQVSMWDPESGKVSSWSRLRPSCWLNIITAGGMLQIPEGGAGCSCGSWLETSIVFAPLEVLKR